MDNVDNNTFVTLMSCELCKTIHCCNVLKRKSVDKWVFHLLMWVLVKILLDSVKLKLYDKWIVYFVLPERNFI